MKLVRLATNDNGYFRSAFGNDMILEPYSRMALLNLTLKSDIGSIPGMKFLGGSTMKLIGQEGTAAEAASTYTFGLPSDEFSDGDFERFRLAVQHQLNKLPNISYGALFHNAIPSNTSGSTFDVATDSSNGNIEISYQYGAFVNPLDIPLEDGGVTTVTSIMNFDETITNVNRPTGQPTDIAKEATESATTGRDNNLLSSVPLATGAAFFTTRVRNLVDNSSGLQDNGFGIGLSKVPLSSLDISPGEEIPVSARTCEISVNRPGENYKFIVNNGTEVTSALAPEHVGFLATTNVNKHDVMGFEIEHGILSLCVYQNQDAGSGGGYIDLTTGNNWIQTGTGTQEIYSEDDLGDIAQYKRSQVGTPGLEQWWQAVGTTNWNIYNTKPVLGSVVDATAVYATNVLTITPSGGGTATFTATGTPTIKPPSQTGLRTVLAQQYINPGEEFYPYIYLRGDSLAIEIDLVNYVVDIARNIEILGLDPLTNKLTDSSAYDNRYAITLQNVATNISKILPVTNSGPYGYEERWDDDLNVEISIPQNILNALGFSRFNVETSASHTFKELMDQTSFIFLTADKLPDRYDSDNFLVESMSVPLDSFDASQVEYRTSTQFNDNVSKSGRRKNILMTIPENENTNGLLEFETSTPIFIDVNNSEKINLKNLDFRVLNKDFSEINQANEQAIMTILIDSIDKRIM